MFGEPHAITGYDVGANVGPPGVPSPSYSSGLGQQKALRQKFGEIGKEFVMANQETKKCAHIPFLCDVPKGIEYCSESCRDAGRYDVEIACQCDHPACPLTVRPYVPRFVADLAN